MRTSESGVVGALDRVVDELLEAQLRLLTVRVRKHEGMDLALLQSTMSVLTCGQRMVEKLAGECREYERMEDLIDVASAVGF